jgi:hypothetical protein
MKIKWLEILRLKIALYKKGCYGYKVILFKLRIKQSFMKLKRYLRIMMIERKKDRELCKIIRGNKLYNSVFDMIIFPYQCKCFDRLRSHYLLYGITTAERLLADGIHLCNYICNCIFIYLYFLDIYTHMYY